MKVIAFSKRETKESKKYLKSDLSLQLATHMYKWLIFQEARDREHWVTEMKGFLLTLLHKLSRISQLKNKRRIYTELNLNAKDLMNHIDSISADALDEIPEEYFENEIVSDVIGDLSGNLKDEGFDILETFSSETGYKWVVTYKNNPLW